VKRNLARRAIVPQPDGQRVSPSSFRVRAKRRAPE
jgi:hypothetical protein